MKASVQTICVMFALAVASCGETDSPVKATRNRVVFSGANANALFQQCSRGVPTPGDGEWRPTEADLDAFEAELPKALAKQPEATDADSGNPLASWRKQYVGIVRGKQRFIYGNFFPASMAVEFDDWRLQPVMVCDGGPSFFGAEFDVSARRITHLQFNGEA
jgi:hypothetical protein